MMCFSNTQGIPVMIRTGAIDMTVMPYFSKRMYRLLKEQGNNVTYSELANKEHWWWDTYNTNDGGATNDPDVRNFLQKHSKFAIKRTSNPGLIFLFCLVHYGKSRLGFDPRSLI